MDHPRINGVFRKSGEVNHRIIFEDTHFYDPLIIPSQFVNIRTYGRTPRVMARESQAQSPIFESEPSTSNYRESDRNETREQEQQTNEFPNGQETLEESFTLAPPSEEDPDRVPGGRTRESSSLGRAFQSEPRTSNFEEESGNTSRE